MFAATESSFGTSDLCLANAGALGGDVSRSVALTMKSVGVDKGLGRFTYLTGQSGRRYMFCLVTRHQAALYGQCVFAVASGACPSVNTLAGSLPAGLRDADRIFVHLPDGLSVGSILDDLATTA